LVFALSTCIVLLLSLSIEQFKEYHQRKMIIYCIPKTSAIDFISAKTNVLYTDTILTKDESKLLFHIKHNWWDLGMNESKIISKDTVSNTLFIRKNQIQFYNKRIAIVDKANESTYLNQLMVTPLSIDYLIVSRNPKIKMEEIIRLYKAKEIVFDSSNSLYHINKWKTECAKLNQHCYSVSESGAFVVDL
jgi:competence protein ComEC